MPDAAALTEAIQRAYASLDDPRYSFVADALADPPYERLLDGLARAFDVQDTTDPNDDVSFRSVLRDDTGAWCLDLSMVGPFALLTRLSDDGRCAVITGATNVESASERLLVSMLADERIELLTQTLLERPIDLRLRSGDGGEPVLLFHALIGDQPVLPWRAGERAGLTLARERALKVRWSTGEVDGLLLHGLRRPDEEPVAEIATVHWPKGTELGEPWLLHGPGWAVDLWTLRLPRLPTGEAWTALLRNALGRLVRVGYAAAWFAVEADFADPPYLFDIAYMGQGVYAAMTPSTGFVSRDEGDAHALQVLDEREIARIRAALPTWAVT